MRIAAKGCTQARFSSVNCGNLRGDYEFTHLAPPVDKTRQKACTHKPKLGTLENVKRAIYLILALLVVGTVGYIVYVYRVQLGLASENSTPTELPNPDLEPAHVAWQVVDRSAQGFRVEMPADAAQITIPAYTERGGAEDVDMIQAAPNSETSYAVLWADNPPVERASGESVDKTLDTAVNGALARSQTTLVNETRANRLGYPARDFTACNDGGGVLNARLILVGQRLYMLIAAFPAASARREEDVNHFFDSFKLASTRRNN